MKKALPMILAAALTGGVVFTAITLINDNSNEESAIATQTGDKTTAAGSNNEVIKEEVVEEETEQMADDQGLPAFFVHEGQASSVSILDNGFHSMSIEDEDNPYTLMWNDQSTVVVDNTGKPANLEEGMHYTAYTSSNKPMMMIYPPNYSPEVIVVQTDEMGTAQYTTLDADYLNESKDIKFNIDAQAVIENLAGESVTIDDAIGKKVLVFYGPTTRSIPAQASPSKILILDAQ